MFYPTAFIIGRRAGVVAAFSVLVAARACGPDFPNAYLAMPAGELVRLPTLDFAAELTRAAVPETAAEKFTPVAEAAEADCERAELQEAMRKAGASQEWIERLSAWTREEHMREMPRVLPREFHLYAEGAREWRERNYGRAIARWREVLALPAAERHYRSVWAAYMIGRAQWDGDGVAACQAFAQTRELAAQGFADSQGLAVASLGWEARVYLQQERFPEALRLYLHQHALGDKRAATSIQTLIRAAFAVDDSRPGDDAGSLLGSPLGALAREQDLRGAVTAWFVARGGPQSPWSTEATRRFRRWIMALAHAAPLTPAEADHWAWAAYQNGLWEDAGKFAAEAPTEAPASEWVRAMLLLREGQVSAAAEHLSAVAKSFPRDAALISPAVVDDEDRIESEPEETPAAQLSGVRGVLALQRSQYVEALRLFRLAGHWSDAAYVAESVLSLEELIAFVRSETQAKPAVIPAVWRPQVGDRTESADRDLRCLLARRLVRAGKFDQAREFFPADRLGAYDHYVALIRQGYERARPAAERAGDLWQAAQLVQRHGMEWQGTELTPDYAIWEGSYEWPVVSRTHSESYDSVGIEAATSISDDERDRVNGRNLPTHRYHYRQRAVELAFLAATLLPDDDERTATILNTAGRWISARDPDGAQLFYKTLVFRCPNTALGKEAAARCWLVPLKDDDASSDAKPL